MNNEKLFDRMRKLLAMAQDESSENEAMIASKRLHALLAKHNLSLTDIGADEETIDEECLVTTSRPWKKKVAAAIGRLYFCRIYWVQLQYPRGKMRLVFAGKEHNRVFAANIFDMIVKTIEKESRAESKKLYGKEVSGFVNSFWSGAAYRIEVRVEELITQSMRGELEDEEGNTLPALASVYDQEASVVEDYMETLNLKTKKLNTRATDAHGLQAGKTAGDRVQLSRALAKKNAPKQLGAN